MSQDAKDLLRQQLAKIRQVQQAGREAGKAAGAEKAASEAATGQGQQSPSESSPATTQGQAPTTTS